MITVVTPASFRCAPPSTAVPFCAVQRSGDCIPAPDTGTGHKAFCEGLPVLEVLPVAFATSKSEVVRDVDLAVFIAVCTAPPTAGRFGYCGSWRIDSTVVLTTGGRHACWRRGVRSRYRRRGCYSAVQRSRFCILAPDTSTGHTAFCEGLPVFVILSVTFATSKSKVVPDKDFAIFIAQFTAPHTAGRLRNGCSRRIETTVVLAA